jgi:hypothetical protein
MMAASGVQSTQCPAKFQLILRDKTWFCSCITLAIKALRAAVWVSGAYLLETSVRFGRLRAFGSDHLS